VYQNLWRAALALAFGTVSLALAEAPAQPARADLVPAAERFVDGLARGEYTAATQQFAEVLVRAMPPDKLGAAWRSLVPGAGVFKQRLSSTSARSESRKSTASPGVCRTGRRRVR